MADPVFNEILLQAVNALTIAEQLLDLDLKNRKHAASDDPTKVKVHLLKLQLDHVLGEARRTAGLEPDGSFNKLPPKPPGVRGGRR